MRKIIGGTSCPPKAQGTRHKAQRKSKSRMKNHPEYQYLELMRECMEKGDKQVDQGHGKAHYGLFGRQIRFNLSDGFPLLTTKRVYWKGVLHEPYWFMSGQTNIKYLVDNDVHIWDDYPYRIYMKSQKSKVKSESQKSKVLTKEEFIDKIKNGSASSPF